MSYIQVNSISGVYPNEIYLCDSRFTTCIYSQTVNGENELPVTLQLPTVLIGVNDLIVKVIDANNCQSFQSVVCTTIIP